CPRLAALAVRYELRHLGRRSSRPSRSVARLLREVAYGLARTMSHDELPEELDVTAYVGPYLFPDTKRRRLAATIYVVLVVACLAGFAVTGNGGALAAAIVLALVVA